MKREITLTKDGSHTLYVENWNESYHSHHGALQESLHVFIENGLNHFAHLKEVSILEYGLGTALNAFLTANRAIEKKQKIHYFAMEKFPLEKQEYELLNYNQIPSAKPDLFQSIHKAAWNQKQCIDLFFDLYKFESDFSEVLNLDIPKVDLIYFDVFGPRVQPEYWNKESLTMAFDMLKPGGRFTTYCCKGSVKRDMMEIGFEVEKRPGAPGKREMLHGRKPL
ncbi:MAG: hypothetical protein C4K58_07500 [Flavobacteriaceae bacterium]|nr:MAG: hypothetical protein C4K58_07500 [Flavobacteriaceae bacterium]